MKQKNDLPAAAVSRPPCEERRVKAHVGTSTLSRDLVWCECMRGISRNGRSKFCPSCGKEIDQDSYSAACAEAMKNGADHFTYHDVDLVNDLEQFSRSLNNCRMLAMREVRRHNIGKATNPLTIEAWGHILRFCEESGVVSSVLRGSSQGSPDGETPQAKEGA